MHELSAARSVVELIHEAVPAADLSAIRSVKMRIGNLAGIVPESLEFCYRVLTEKSRLAQSRLVFERVPFALHCSGCNTTTACPGGMGVCPNCSSTATTVVSGTELQLAAIELEEGGPEDSPWLS